MAVRTQSRGVIGAPCWLPVTRDTFVDLGVDPHLQSPKARQVHPPSLDRGGHPKPPLPHLVHVEELSQLPVLHVEERLVVSLEGHLALAHIWEARESDEHLMSIETMSKRSRVVRKRVGLDQAESHPGTFGSPPIARTFCRTTALASLLTRDKLKTASLVSSQLGLDHSGLKSGHEQAMTTHQDCRVLVHHLLSPFLL